MAQKVTITLEDDLDGSPATETVTFGLDGATYEIDLNDKNAKAMRKALDQFVAAARKSSGARRGRPPGSVNGTGTKRGGNTRKRVASIADIEASKEKDKAVAAK